MSKKQIFTTVPMSRPQYNRFDLSHDVKTTFKMGYLVPTTLMEILPGDRVNINIENLLRFAPLVSPVMHKIKATTHFFFVPNRIIWPDWEDFITGQTVDPPYINLTQAMNEKSLGNYLGYPITGAFNQPQVSALPLAAYNKIFNEYYRDQNLVLERTDTLTPGDNSINFDTWMNLPPARRAWQHDYFTSALPFAQKGDSALLPLGTFQDVDVTLDIQGAPNTGMLVRDSTGALLANQNIRSSDVPPGTLEAGANFAFLDPNGNLKATTSDLEAMAADITDVRKAFKLQEFLEREARGGTRYTEQLKSAFGVISSDKRLQRPEYIGGAYQNMVISEVLSTAQTEAQSEVTPVGNMAGHGISVGGGKGFNYRAEEHGWIIGIINVQPETAYQNGLHRHFTRFDRYDYFWKEFSHIGEQAVLNKEVYVDRTDGDETFGYIPRYSEYKYMNSRVSGEFQTSLDYWHLGRKFDTQNIPNLNEFFIECNPDPRIFAVTDPNSDHIYAHIFNHISAIRPIPKFSMPGL